MAWWRNEQEAAVLFLFSDLIDLQVDILPPQHQVVNKQKKGSALLKTVIHGMVVSLSSSSKLSRQCKKKIFRQ